MTRRWIRRATGFPDPCRDLRRTGEDDDRERRRIGCVALDDERFLTSLGVAGERAVREAEPVGLVDHVCDPARGQRVQRARARGDDHVGARGNGRVGGVHLDARAEMRLPRAESGAGACERAGSEIDAVPVVCVAGWKVGIARRADLGVAQ